MVVCLRLVCVVGWECVYCVMVGDMGGLLECALILRLFLVVDTYLSAVEQRLHCYVEKVPPSSTRLACFLFFGTLNVFGSVR